MAQWEPDKAVSCLPCPHPHPFWFLLDTALCHLALGKQSPHLPTFI